MAPLVSICLPTLNARRFLEPRMESILSQDMADWELIVCDSHSRDGTWEYFQQFKTDSRVRLYQVPREGLYAGWNECLKRAKGEFVTIATADDTSRPQFLKKMTAALQLQPGVKLAICPFASIDENGQVIENYPPRKPSDIFAEWLKVAHRRSGLVEFLVHLVRGGSWTTITSVVFARTLLDKAGLFLEKETSVVDQLWAAKVSLLTDSLWIPEPLATWRIHDSQRSSVWSRRLAWRQVELTARTIRECSAMLPESWKQDPRWMEKLMWGAWHFYHSCYGLNRDTLAKYPGKFVADMGWGLVHEPAYVGRRLASGLSWKVPEYEDSTEFVHKLIRDWQVPWPPVPVEGRLHH
jgi:glycosyltransferase involved in cell wall biosynthesis